jgi:hypothetical protein
VDDLVSIFFFFSFLFFFLTLSLSDFFDSRISVSRGEQERRFQNEGFSVSIPIALNCSLSL